MFKFKIGEKVLYKNKPYRIINRVYTGIDLWYDLQTIEKGKSILFVHELALKPISKYTIKIINNENNNEHVYLTNDISIENETIHINNKHFTDISGELTNLKFISSL
ncbi:hypothetical protein H9L25_00345 [Terrisporobacter mayombei]|nr:hypothetical protein [Terrisporobacter mayombei]